MGKLGALTTIRFALGWAMDVVLAIILLLLIIDELKGD